MLECCSAAFGLEGVMLGVEMSMRRLDWGRFALAVLSVSGNAWIGDGELCFLS